MTLFIYHRQSTLKKISKIEKKNVDGLEIDLRSSGKKIIISHDPFKKELNFSKNINFFKNFFLVVDIKSTGIAKKVSALLKRKKIKFLLLNLISSEFVELATTKVSKNIFLRFSYFEKHNLKNKYFKKIKWVWYDFFENKFLSLDDYKYLKRHKKKICLTSPDLLGKSKKILLKLIKHLNRNKIKVDMICVKPKALKIWKKFYIYQ